MPHATGGVVGQGFGDRFVLLGSLQPKSQKEASGKQHGLAGLGQSGWAAFIEDDSRRAKFGPGYI